MRSHVESQLSVNSSNNTHTRSDIDSANGMSYSATIHSIDHVLSSKDPLPGYYVSLLPRHPQVTHPNQPT